MTRLATAARALAILVGVECAASCDQAYVGEPPSTARVAMTPAAPTLRVGDSVLVQAVALDQRGRPIESQRNRPLLSSSDTATVGLVHVTAPGGGAAAAWAHGRRAGVAVLRAESRVRRDSVVVTVR